MASKSEDRGPSASDEFDVFLCHNSADKEEVQGVAEQLRARGLKPWIDDRELPLGQPAAQGLQERIATAKAFAVFVGASGLGRWQKLELDAAWGEHVKRGCPVIPVLLRDCPADPWLPPFLGMNTWVDLRREDPDPVEVLHRGITGKAGRVRRDAPLIDGDRESLRHRLTSEAIIQRQQLKSQSFKSTTRRHSRISKLMLAVMSGILVALALVAWKLVLYKSRSPSPIKAIAIKRQTAPELSATTMFDMREPNEAGRSQDGVQPLRYGTAIAFDVPRSLLRSAQGATVLWVDDHPENNIREREALESVDIRFVLATSNAEALDEIRSRPPGLIISDMGRDKGKDLIAGYSLLDSLRQFGIAVPVIIYSDYCSPERRAEARRLGAFGCTYGPAELFNYALAALRANPP